MTPGRGGSALGALVLVLSLPLLHPAPAGASSTDSLRWRADRTPYARGGVTLSSRGDAGAPRLHAAGDSAGIWNEVPPPRRSRPFLLHDAVGDRLVLAGNQRTTLDGDLWALPLDGDGHWSRLPAPTGPAPPVLEGAEAAFDAANRRLLVFSGFADNGGFLDLVFALGLDPVPNWSIVPFIPDAPRPGGRQDAAVAWDAVRGRLLVFGGRGDRRAGDDDSGTRNDVWSLDGSGGGWSQVVAAGDPPAPRWGASAVVTPDGSKLLLFGGYVRVGQYSSAATGETWELSLGAEPRWALVPPLGDAPSPGGDQVAFWDSTYAGGAMILVQAFADTVLHAFDPVARSWSVVPGDGTAPTSWPGPAMARDPGRDRYLFYDRNPEAPDARALDVLELGAVATWSRSGGPVLGPGRFGHATALDVRGDRMIVFGGVGTSQGGDNYLAAPWELSLADLTRWTPLEPAGEAPPPRHEPVGVFDDDRNRAVFFGGWTYRDNYLDDTWELAMEGTPRWTRLLPAGELPEGRRAHGVAHDPVRRRMIVFGGIGRDSVLSDLWALDLAGEPRWVRLEPAGERPGPRHFPALAYDAGRDRILMHGGGFDGHSTSELWELTLDDLRWRRIEEEGYPLALERHGMVHDPARDRLLVYGGWEVDYDVLSSINAVFTFELDEAPRWSYLRTSGTPWRWVISPSWVLDPRRDRVVTFSGDHSFTFFENAVLSLDFASDPAPADAWLRHARPFADRVEIEWESIAPGAGYDLERKEAPGEWRALATLVAGGDGRFGYVDRAVRAGWRYTYRLSRRATPGAAFVTATGPTFGQVAVDVPGGAAVQLVGPRPNPSRPGETTLWFSLASTAGASLEIFDARGRRLWAMDLTGSAPGPQVVRPGFMPSAGVHFARLRGPGGEDVRRFVVVP